MKATITALLLAAATTICSAASAASADDYVGKWVNVNVPTNTVVIESKGAAFVWHETNFDAALRGMHTSPPRPAKFVNGVLQVVTMVGPLPFTITGTGHLVGGDMEFARAQR